MIESCLWYPSSFTSNRVENKTRENMDSAYINVWQCVFRIISCRDLDHVGEKNSISLKYPNKKKCTYCQSNEELTKNQYAKCHSNKLQTVKEYWGWIVHLLKDLIGHTKLWKWVTFEPILHTFYGSILSLSYLED